RQKFGYNSFNRIGYKNLVAVKLNFIFLADSQPGNSTRQGIGTGVSTTDLRIKQMTKSTPLKNLFLLQICCTPQPQGQTNEPPFK
ncbi:MAG: hypothetical protein R6X32_05610, partial [Chloroflexota bacterium]